MIEGRVRAGAKTGHFKIDHDYDSNYIFAEPIKDVKDETLVEAFQKSIWNTRRAWYEAHPKYYRQSGGETH